MRVRGQIWVASRITPQEVIVEGVRKKMIMGGKNSWHGKRREAGTVYRSVLKPAMTKDFTPQFQPQFCLTALQTAPTTVPSHPFSVALHSPEPGEFQLTAPFQGPLSYSKANMVFWSPWEIQSGRFFRIFLISSP